MKTIKLAGVAIVSLMVFAACSKNETQTEAPAPLAAAEDFSKDLSLEQLSVYQVASAPPVTARDLSVDVKLSKADGKYKVGDAFSFTATPSQDGYLWVTNVHRDGKQELLFPSEWQPDNAVKAGQAITLPGGSKEYGIKVGGAPGADLLTVTLTKTKTPPSGVLAGGETKNGFYVASGSAADLAKDLELVSQAVNCAVSKDLDLVAAEQKDAPKPPASAASAPAAGGGKDSHACDAAKPDEGFAVANKPFMIVK